MNDLGDEIRDALNRLKSGKTKRKDISAESRLYHSAVRWYGLRLAHAMATDRLESGSDVLPKMEVDAQVGALLTIKKRA